MVHIFNNTVIKMIIVSAEGKPAEWVLAGGNNAIDKHDYDFMFGNDSD